MSAKNANLPDIGMGTYRKWNENYYLIMELSSLKMAKLQLFPYID